MIKKLGAHFWKFKHDLLFCLVAFFARALDDKSEEWVSTKHALHKRKQDLGVPLRQVRDGDELCVFYCGHFGWKGHNEVITTKGSEATWWFEDEA